MQPQQFHLTFDMFKAGTHMLCMWDDWLWGLGSSCELNMGFRSSEFHLKSVSYVAFCSDGLPSFQTGVHVSWVRRQFVEMALKPGCWIVFEVMASRLTWNIVKRWGDTVLYLWVNSSLIISIHAEPSDLCSVQLIASRCFSALFRDC